ncbi:MAG: hypothetical protein NTZ49_03870 [Candidatus Parcubacteria bacterium]|nr:hypothetical protein [Candidatus Parcubacteria bacterium]
MENIFTTLYKYKPQPEITPAENFFTESLKIVLSSDSELLNKFVKYISGDLIFRAPFILESQVRYGNSIIDLQITDKNYKKIFIEVKVNAHENRYLDDDTEDDFGQVEKYLRMNNGYVCFITKDQCNIQVKSHKNNFLGQFEWFEIYRIINNYLDNTKIDKTKTYLISNFLKFMKNLDMQPFQGFNNKDIALSKTNFLDFFDKLLDFLKEVNRDKRIISFCKKHKLSPMFNTPKYDHRNKVFYLILGRPEWRWSKQLYFGFELWRKGEFESFGEGLAYYQGIFTYPKANYEKIRKPIKNIKINNKYFEKDKEPGWSLLKRFKFSIFIKLGDKQAITYIYNSLLELEKSGVMDVLKKLR